MSTTADATAVSTGPVTLVIPPAPSMVRVGRLTASSIASIADMSIDDIDDIKIAVSEMITLMIQSGDRSAITLRFEIIDQALIVEASTPATGLDTGHNDVALATAVLDAVSDNHDVAFLDDHIVMRVVKTTGAQPAS